MEMGRMGEGETGKGGDEETERLIEYFLRLIQYFDRYSTDFKISIIFSF